MDRREIGRIGEEAAANYLTRKGYIIKERNFRLTVGEIDIIALASDGCTVFVEVKTRKNADYGCAAEFVDKNKQQRLIKTAQLYCDSDIYMRFDIIEVYYEARNNMVYITEINHIENAF